MNSSPLTKVSLMVLVCLMSWTAVAQQSVPAPAAVVSPSAVPKLVNYRGVLKDANGKALTGVTGVTFLLYKDEQGGTPLWMETQNVTPGRDGLYTVTLGATTSRGVPADIFVAGEAHWLAVQVQGQAEQARVLLVSVPYALKAGDAETVGGLPPSAFVLAAPPVAGSTAETPAGSSNIQQQATTAVTGAGTTGFIPQWTSASAIGNSAMFQTGSGTTAKVGINTNTPASALDVKGNETVRGTLSLPATAAATATVGKNSQAETLAASVFNSTSKAAVNQTFQWQAEPAGNNTATPSGTLNLLFGSGANKPAETGFRIANNGKVTFAAGQTFPGTGSGTITGVTAGTDLTGGGTSGVVTLKLDTSKVPQLNTFNTFTQPQAVNSQMFITATGSGTAVFVTATGGVQNGLESTTDHVGGIALLGIASDTTGGGGAGVSGVANGPTSTGGSFAGSTGVTGFSSVCCSGFGGVFAGATPPSGSGLNGTAGLSAIGGNSDLATGTAGPGGLFNGGTTGLFGDAILAQAGTGFAGDFNGDLNVGGTIFAGTKDFRIDHPLDPANKYLVHASVESSEMMNIYTGNITTDTQGEATVMLPNWFEVLNTDFRYQLTVIGQFAQAIVAREIHDHQFQIRTNTPNVKVSWQVTGVRQDAFAKANPLVVEQEKDERMRGFYIHPALYGAPEEKQLGWARHPEMMKQIKEKRARFTTSTQPVPATESLKPVQSSSSH